MISGHAARQRPSIRASARGGRSHYQRGRLRGRSKPPGWRVGSRRQGASHRRRIERGVPRPLSELIQMSPHSRGNGKSPGSAEMSHPVREYWALFMSSCHCFSPQCPSHPVRSPRALDDEVQRDVRAVIDHLEDLGRPLTYDEFVSEIAAIAPAGSDIHWMADNQLVNIFFARRTADSSLLTSRLRKWVA